MQYARDRGPDSYTWSRRLVAVSRHLPYTFQDEVLQLLSLLDEPAETRAARQNDFTEGIREATRHLSEQLALRQIIFEELQSHREQTPSMKTPSTS